MLPIKFQQSPREISFKWCVIIIPLIIIIISISIFISIFPYINILIFKNLTFIKSLLPDSLPPFLNFITSYITLLIKSIKLIIPDISSYILYISSYILAALFSSLILKYPIKKILICLIKYYLASYTKSQLNFSDLTFATSNSNLVVKIIPLTKNNILLLSIFKSPVEFLFNLYFYKYTVKNNNITYTLYSIQEIQKTNIQTKITSKQDSDTGEKIKQHTIPQLYQYQTINHTILFNINNN